MGRKSKDLKGVAQIVLVGIIVIMLVAVIAVVAFVALGVGSYESDKGSDSGVDSENTIGYLTISVDITYSHPWTGVVDSYLQEPSVSFQRASTMQITTIYVIGADLLGWLDDDVYQYLEFRVHSLTLEYDEVSDQEACTFSAKCGLGDTVTLTKECPQRFYLKDEGTYSIDVKLYQRHGGTQAWELVDTKIASVKV